MKVFLSEVFFILGDSRRKLPLMMMFFLFMSVIDLISIGLIAPYVSLLFDISGSNEFFDWIFSTIGLNKDKEELLVLFGMLLVAVFAFKAVVAILINRSIIKFSQEQQFKLRNYLMETYQRLPYVNYLDRNSSEYVYSIQDLTAQYANSVLLPLLNIVSSGVVAIVIIAFLAFINSVELFLMLFLFGFVMLIYDRSFYHKLGLYGKRANRSSTKLIRGIHEGIEGLKEIRILGKEEYFLDMVRTGAKEYSVNNILGQIISTAPRYLLELVLIIFIVLLVMLTLQLDKDLHLLAPTLSLFGVAAIRLLPIANIITTSLTRLRYNRDAVSRLYSDLIQIDRTESQRENRHTDTKFETFNKLQLNGVQFSYPNTTQIALNNISLEIQSGESIGLIGASGSGKTTLVDILLGLMSPQQGTIKYNDNPLQDVLSIWQDQVAYLPQQIFLIDDTLRRNIALGVNDENIDDKILELALDQAELMEMVNHLPDGIDTVIGERGVRLSGGQRQRIALARAFYHGRNILVMDESTSALDSETEKEIVDEIQKFKGKKTIIVVAHRFSTIQYCDRIYKLENGSIIQQGSPKEVLGVG